MSDVITQSFGLPGDIAQRIGYVAIDEQGRETGPAPIARPQSQLDWALHWIRQGLHVFPCRNFLGLPSVKDWYSAATIETAQVVQWWAEQPTADIGCAPDKSGHFVIVGIGEIGCAHLDTLDLHPEFETENRWGDRHLWFPGRAYSSWNALAPKVHVVGSGRYVYLPNSLAPNADRDLDESPDDDLLQF